MILKPSHLTSKICRVCKYYDVKEELCAVAPDYLGLAHLCQDFEVCFDLDGEGEEIELKRYIYEKFSRDYLVKLLSPYGKIEVERTLITVPEQDIDLWFAPSVSSPTELGLLGRLAKNRALFESYHNAVTAYDIKDSMLKLFDTLEEFCLARKRRNLAVPKSELPRLWILTPTISETVLRGFDAREEERGVYVMASGYRTGLVVIDNLSQSFDTLWLRLLGRGKVRHQALLELATISVNSYYHSVKESFSNLLYNLQNLPDKDDEDNLLIKQLVMIYDLS